MQYTLKQNSNKLPQTVLLTTLVNLDSFFKSHFNYVQHSVFIADQNYDQQTKDILFRNRPKCLSFLVSIAGSRHEYERRK